MVSLYQVLSPFTHFSTCKVLTNFLSNIYQCLSTCIKGLSMFYQIVIHYQLLTNFGQFGFIVFKSSISSNRRKPYHMPCSLGNATSMWGTLPNCCPQEGKVHGHFDNPLMFSYGFCVGSRSYAAKETKDTGKTVWASLSPNLEPCQPIA